MSDDPIQNRVTGSTVATLPGSTISTLPPPAAYSYAPNGNLLSKPGLSNVTYGGPRPHAVTSATVKGVARSYAYDAAGYVTADGKRTYTWTSFGQLASLDYLSAPALQTFSGITVYDASRVQSDFSFDAGGNRAKQLKQRIAANDSRQLEETLYLGSYEREIHMTKATAVASPVVTKTVHRHSLGGFAVYTKTTGTTGSVVRLSTILKDHLGSTDLILTGQWNGSAFANHETELQSFDAWGERRAADTFVTYRATDSDPFRTSALDYDRGYTGHEQLDDSGLIHMNGRIYDPELGRMLSPDPFVQVPEYSQNFNRYSYVMNNPLNLTDPTGFSWLSNVFKKATNWLSKNWKTVVAIVVVIIAWYVAPYIVAGFYGAAGIVTTPAVFQGAAGAVAGALSGAANAAIAGGDGSDILRGALVGGIQGGISGGILHQMQVNASSYGDKLVHVAGHGVLGGASNAAMGGKFQDGFLSAAAGATASWSGIYAATESTGVVGRTITSGIIGGTASALGGGKFANGAYTAAFQHLLNAEMGTSKDMLLKAAHDQGKKWYYWLFNKGNGPIEQVANGSRQYGPGGLKGQCAAGAQVLCGHGSSDMPMVKYWRAGPTIFELWKRGFGVPVGAVFASFNSNGTYDNMPGGAGAGNHTILFLGSTGDGRYRIADQYNYVDQEGLLHSKNYSIVTYDRERMSQFRLVLTDRIKD